MTFLPTNFIFEITLSVGSMCVKGTLISRFPLATQFLFLNLESLFVPCPVPFNGRTTWQTALVDSIGLKGEFRISREALNTAISILIYVINVLRKESCWILKTVKKICQIKQNKINREN